MQGSDQREWRVLRALDEGARGEAPCAEPGQPPDARDEGLRAQHERLAQMLRDLRAADLPVRWPAFRARVLKRAGFADQRLDAALASGDDALRRVDWSRAGQAACAAIRTAQRGTRRSAAWTLIRASGPVGVAAALVLIALFPAREREEPGWAVARIGASASAGGAMPVVRVEFSARTAESVERSWPMDAEEPQVADVFFMIDPPTHRVAQGSAIRWLRPQ